MTKKKDPSELKPAGRPKGAKNRRSEAFDLTIGFRCAQADKEAADSTGLLYRDIFRAGIAALASK